MTVDIQSGLVLYLPLDDDSGSSYTKDLSPYSNTGELNYISDPNWVDGISGKCLNLDGVQECVNCEDDSSLDVSNEVTVSAWIKLDDLTSGYQTIVGKWISASGERCYIFQVNDDKLEVWYSVDGDVSPHIASSTTLTTEWTHAAFVLGTDDTIRMYINGVQDATTASLTAINQHIQNTYVGKYAGGEFFNGRVDEIRIYNRGLNVTECNYLYKNPSGTNINLVSALLMVTDLDGDVHAITEDIENVTVSNVLSYASDTFNCEVANHDDVYNFIEYGCEIDIYLGFGGYNTQRLTGIVTDSIYTLDSSLVEGRIELSGEDIVYRSNNIYVFCIIEETKEISDILEIVLETVDISTGKSYLELADIDNDYTFIETSDYTSDSTIFAWTSLSKAISELAEYVGFEWYIDINKKIHFYEPVDVAPSATITDDDLSGNPRIGHHKNTTNRAIVLGGYGNTVDQEGVPSAYIYKVTDLLDRECWFIPTQNMLSTIYIYTETYTSESDLILTLEDSSSNIISNSLITVYKNDIAHEDYTKFTFPTFLNLVVGQKYYIHLEGTTSDGVGVGIEVRTGRTIFDFQTTYPTRTASLVNDTPSYDRYGMYTAVPHVDNDIVDYEVAMLKAKSMLNGDPKKGANISILDDSVTVGDTVTLNLSTPGIVINQDMKVMKSTLTTGHKHIKNDLELEEL